MSKKHTRKPSSELRDRTRSRTDDAPRKRRTHDQRPERRDDVDPDLVPSRAAVLEALQGTPMSSEELLRELRVDKRARHALAARLAAMERDGQILTNRKGDLCAVAKLHLVTGVR